MCFTKGNKNHLRHFLGTKHCCHGNIHMFPFPFSWMQNTSKPKCFSKTLSCLPARLFWFEIKLAPLISNQLQLKRFSSKTMSFYMTSSFFPSIASWLSPGRSHRKCMTRINCNNWVVFKSLHGALVNPIKGLAEDRLHSPVGQSQCHNQKPKSRTNQQPNKSKTHATQTKNKNKTKNTRNAKSAL